MKFLTEPKVFSKHISIINELIERKRHLPEQVFHGAFSQFTFIDSDEVMENESFFERMKLFLAFLNEPHFFLIVLEPDPENYFFRLFGKYPILEMSVNDEGSEYVSKLKEDPGDSRPDAIRFNSTILLMYSESRRWALYVDRDLELCVAGFSEKKLLQLFVSMYGSERTFTVKEVIEQFLAMVYRKQGVPEEVSESLTKNYGTPKKL